MTYHAKDFREPETPRFFEPIMQTAELLLVGKPAGIPVTRTGLIVRNTFINLLRNHFGDDLHPLHRLDRETSGLLLCARGSAACRKYQRHQPPPMTGKYYLAVVFGTLPTGATICSEQPLATRADSPVRCRMWPETTGKACRTFFHILATTGDFSLVLAELQTGRRHQIRAHLAHLGQPVVGDKIYSHEGHYFLKRIAGELEEADYLRLGSHNQLLHAWALRLHRPGHPERLYFSQLFSEEFRDYLGLFPGWEETARGRLAKLTPMSQFSEVSQPACRDKLPK
ncbi:MAG: RNA pseudouridine synthase [Desulfobulbaceae bacterium]|nr:RNA pseudouridine synthase [Desulfobulbaceae bacterium]